MKVVESASKLFLYGNDMKAYDKIPAGTYDICYSEMGGFIYLVAKIWLSMKKCTVPRVARWIKF